MKRKEKEEIIELLESLRLPEKPCDDCINRKGCINCVDGSEWAHYEEVKEPIHRTQEEIDAAMQEVEEKIKAFSAAYPNGFQLPSEEAEHTCDLETEIDNYIGHPQEADEDASITAIRQAAHHFAQWQKEQMMKDTIETTVKIDAGGYPYVERVIELYDYDKDEPLAKEGDKIKLIIIKEEEL